MIGTTFAGPGRSMETLRLSVNALGVALKFPGVILRGLGSTCDDTDPSYNRSFKFRCGRAVDGSGSVCGQGKGGSSIEEDVGASSEPDSVPPAPGAWYQMRSARLRQSVPRARAGRRGARGVSGSGGAVCVTRLRTLPNVACTPIVLWNVCMLFISSSLSSNSSLICGQDIYKKSDTAETPTLFWGRLKKRYLSCLKDGADYRDVD